MSYWLPNRNRLSVQTGCAPAVCLSSLARFKLGNVQVETTHRVARAPFAIAGRASLPAACFVDANIPALRREGAIGTLCVVLNCPTSEGTSRRFGGTLCEHPGASEGGNSGFLRNYLRCVKLPQFVQLRLDITPTLVAVERHSQRLRTAPKTPSESSMTFGYSTVFTDT